MKTFFSAVALATVAVASVAGSATADFPLPPSVDLPEVQMSAQAVLDTYCDGTPIMTQVETFPGSDGTFDGNCTIKLGERGELKTGKYGKVTISGMLTVTTSDSPRESELQVEEQSSLTAGSMDLSVKELQVKTGATIATTDGDLMVSALRQVQVEEMGTVSAEKGSVSIVAAREVQLKMMSTVKSSESVTISAMNCQVEMGATVTAPEKSVC